MRWLVALVAVAIAFPGAAVAQKNQAAKPAHEYRALPFDGNMADVLKGQLLKAKETEILQELYRSLVDQKLVRPDANPNDSDTQEKMQQMLKNAVSQLKSKFTPKQLKEMQDALQKRKENAAGMGQRVDPTGSLPKAGSPQHAPFDAKNLPPPETANGGITNLDKLVKDVVNRMEHTDFAHLDNKTGGSAAFQQFKERLAGHHALARALGGIKADGGLGSLPLPDFKWLKLPAVGDGKLGSVLPRFDVFKQPAGFPFPQIAPGLSSLPLQLLVGLALVAGMAIAWKLLVHRGQRQTAAATADLGPWPLQPAQISTRQQLIQAFEYLAVLTLGHKARTANHRAIAGGLGSTPEQCRAAMELATLYEKARYEPGAAELASADLAAARRDLCLLAGMREPVLAPGAG